MILTSHILFSVLVFVFGTIIGSFLNVVILRHEKEESLTGRSYCPHCKKKLVWYELVPVFSYLIQRGKCRGCSTHISVQYPLVELTAGIMFVLVVFKAFDGQSFIIPNSVFILQTFLGLVIWSLLIVITVYDLRTKLIPDRFSYTFSALALVLLFVPSIVTPYALPPTTWLLAGPAYFLPFYLLWKVSGGKWIGLGDGKLALGIGWYLGLVQGGSALLLSFWIGASVSLLIIGIQRIMGSMWAEKYFSHSKERQILTLKSEIPFGPFLILGMFLVYFFDIDVLASILF